MANNDVNMGWGDADEAPNGAEGDAHAGAAAPGGPGAGAARSEGGGSISNLGHPPPRGDGSYQGGSDPP